MRSLFVRTFLWFWLTVLAVAVALVLVSRKQQQAYVLGANLRVFIFETLLPAEAKQSAQIFENSGADALKERLESLELRYPVQPYFFSADGVELEGRAAPFRIRDLAHLVLAENRHYEIANLAAEAAAGPSGRRYSMVFLQEPSDQYNRQSKSIARTLIEFELPALILAASGLFCFFSARYVTRPIVNLRASAAAIADGHLETRVDPKWKQRSDEIGELTRDFDLMASRIESLVAGQRRLLGDVSHELRSPLARLMAALGLLKQQPRWAESGALIERIGLEARRLDQLIGQLLTLARIESGAAAEMRSFDLTNLVEEIARDAGFEARAQARDVAVLQCDPCRVDGSEDLLRSAVENVMRNAVRYAPQGTQVEVSLEARANRAILTIRDHGPGVPAQSLQEIFHPFRRMDSQDGAQAGAGLGLAITDRAVRLHGCTVRAENAIDGGLAVEIDLPATPRR